MDRPLIAQRNRRHPIGPGIPNTRKILWLQNQRRIGVADVPFRPLRSRDIWRKLAAFMRCLNQWKDLGNHPAFRVSTRRTPTPDRQPSREGGTERGLVDTGLTSRNKASKKLLHRPTKTTNQPSPYSEK